MDLFHFIFKRKELFLALALPFLLFFLFFSFPRMVVAGKSGHGSTVIRGV